MFLKVVLLPNQTFIVTVNLFFYPLRGFTAIISLSFSLKDVSEERDDRGQAGAQRAAAASDSESVAQLQRPRLQPAAGATGDQGEQRHQGRQLLIKFDASFQLETSAPPVGVTHYASFSQCDGAVQFSSRLTVPRLPNVHTFIQRINMVRSKPACYSETSYWSLECFGLAVALPECLASHLLTFIHFIKHI